VDALADLSIGTNSHVVLTSLPVNYGEVLAINSGLIHNLAEPHLVMHGSSSVPEDLIAIINKYGGGS